MACCPTPAAPGEMGEGARSPRGPLRGIAVRGGGGGGIGVMEKVKERERESHTVRIDQIEQPWILQDGTAQANSRELHHRRHGQLEALHP